MTPIIMPINNTRTVNCIIQDGIRYCEKREITKQEGGMISLLIAFTLLWLVFWCWISEKIEDKWGIFPLFPAFLGGFVLPAIIIGLILVF